MVDMSKYRSWAQGSKCYEQLRTMVDMNDSRSWAERPLDVMNNFGLRMIWVIVSHETMALSGMKILGL